MRKKKSEEEELYIWGNPFSVTRLKTSEE